MTKEMTKEETNEFLQCVKKLETQKRYCEEQGLPFFANRLYCPFCYRSIYRHITMEQAVSQHITGCPECHKTFCD